MGKTRADSEANQTAERLTEAVQESYKVIAEEAIGLQERNVRFFQNVFASWNETVLGQAEDNRAMTRGLVEQAQKRREAFRELVHASVDVYMDVLDSMFPYSQDESEAAKRGR